MKRVVAYYPSWSISADHENFRPNQIDFEKITHLNYAFIDIDRSTSTVALLDSYAENQLLLELTAAAKKYPHVKMMFSVGGWLRSAGFRAAAATQAARVSFADSCVALMRKWNFHGIDLDWEYPTFRRHGDTIDHPNDQGTPEADDAEAETFPLLLKTVREKLDAAGREDGCHYLLSIVVSINPRINWKVAPNTYAHYVDFIHVMSYDMHGAFENITGHHSALFANPYEPYDELERTYFNTDAAMQFFLACGIPKDKLVLGIPFYSRGWGSVSKNYPIKAATHGIDLPGLFTYGTNTTKGQWDGGVNAGCNPYHYIEMGLLADPSFTKYRDPWAKTPYIYSATKNEMYTYEDAWSIREKMKYVKRNGYGGCIVWELTGDRTGQLLTAICEELHGKPSTINGESTNHLDNNCIQVIVNGVDTTLK